MKIGLMGAGAVGCYIVAGLHDRYGENFMLIADGSRKERLERDGLIINGRRYFPRAVPPERPGMRLWTTSSWQSSMPRWKRASAISPLPSQRIPAWSA